MMSFYLKIDKFIRMEFFLSKIIDFIGYFKQKYEHKKKLIVLYNFNKI